MSDRPPNAIEVAIAQVIARLRREEIAPLRERIAAAERDLANVERRLGESVELGNWRPEHASWRNGSH